MKRKRTKEDFREYVNNMYSDNYTLPACQIMFAYLATEDQIREAHATRTINDLIENGEPMQYENDFEDWQSGAWD